MKFRVSKVMSTRWLPQILSISLVLPPNLGAQQPVDASKPMAPLPTVRNLRMIVLAGNGEMNDLERRVMAPLVVNVLDQNDRPVDGAAVVFRFPPNGPSASFSNGEKSRTVRTNADGQAAALDWMANSEIGSFQVRVTASRGNEVGEATLSMANASRVTERSIKRQGRSAWSSPWVKVAIVAGAAGAVAGIVLATRGGDGTPTISASPGSPTVGGPR